MDQLEGELGIRRLLTSCVGGWKWRLKDNYRMHLKGIRFAYPGDRRMFVTIEFEQVQKPVPAASPRRRKIRI